MRRTVSHDRRVISCREADRIYRMRKGSASAAFKSGQIPGRKRGRAFLLSAKRAEELWGVDGVLSKTYWAAPVSASPTRAQR